MEVEEGGGDVVEESKTMFFVEWVVEQVEECGKNVLLLDVSYGVSGVSGIISG